MSKNTRAVRSVPGKSDEGDDRAEMQSPPPSKDDMRALHNFGAAHPKALQYLFDYVYRKAYTEGEKAGFDRGKKERDRQRRGEKPGITRRPRGRPEEIPLIWRNLLDELMADPQWGSTKTERLETFLKKYRRDMRAEGLEVPEFAKTSAQKPAEKSAARIMASQWQWRRTKRI